MEMPSSPNQLRAPTPNKMKSSELRNKSEASRASSAHLFFSWLQIKAWLIGVQA
uniref:Orf108a n=1 Tax=Rhizophora mucronata TaxID=61149 RepID=A0A2P2P8B5_RHIMU